MAFGAITKNDSYRIPAGESITTAVGVKFEHVEAGHYIFHGAAVKKSKEQQETEDREFWQRIAEVKARMRETANYAG